MASPKRGRKFRLILYPEDLTHASALLYIGQNFPMYSFILHDKDIDKDGNLKKAHWHVVIWFSNARYLSALAVELGIEENYIQLSNNAVHDLRYLVHADDPDKYQYDISEVQTTMSLELQKALKDSTEESRVISILDLMDEQKHIIKTSAFIRMICQKGLYSDFRRSSSIFLKCLQEHNDYVYAGVYKPDFEDGVSDG